MQNTNFVKIAKGNLAFYISGSKVLSPQLMEEINGFLEKEIPGFKNIETVNIVRMTGRFASDRLAVAVPLNSIEKEKRRKFSGVCEKYFSYIKV